MKPAQAHKFVTELERDAAAPLALFLPDPHAYVEALLALEDDPAEHTAAQATARIADAIGPEATRVVAELSTLAQATPGEDLVDLTRWARTRVVYLVDPDLAEALADTDPDTVIPGDVLTRLPYPNPLVMLPEPVRFAHDGGGQEVYSAMVVCGARMPERGRCSTHDETRDGLSLMFYGYVCDERGRPLQEHVPSVVNGGLRTIRTQLGMRVTVSLEDETVAERQARSVAGMMARSPVARNGFVDDDAARDACNQLCALGLNLLVYLVADNSDQQPVTDAPTRRQRRRAHTAGTPTRFVELGYRVGRALRASRAEAAAAGRSGRTVAPHLRRAHLHTYRVGPGRTGRVVRWLPPTAVNWDGPAQVNQMVRPH